MFMESVTERISVDEGVLIICRKYMAIQTLDGVLHPADMDEYGQFLPIWELIRLLSYNADLSGEISEQTREVLRQAFLGEHSQLSHTFCCNEENAWRNKTILKAIDPKTETDYVRVYSLIVGGFDGNVSDCLFTCREELREYLCHYMDAEDAYKLSESVRKGRFYTGEPVYDQERDLNKYKELIARLPENAANMFSKIKYLPEKTLMQSIVHYAILAANSLIKNDDEVLLKLA